MKILISDFLFVNAHKCFNCELISYISEFADVTVISANGYYDDVKNSFADKGIKVIDIKLDKNNKGKIKSRIYSLNLMKKTSQIIKNGQFDMNICLAFDTLVTFLGASFLKKTPLAVFHHKNIDELTNSVKKCLFNFYKNKIYHFVFEDFFAEHLVNDISIKKDNVFVITHPVIKSDFYAEEFDVYEQDYIDCVGLSNSNSEDFIKQCVLKNEEFKQKGVKILLRSKQPIDSLSNVTVINGRLDYSEYDELLIKAKAILVPLPKSYIYRLSGAIYDAISRRKIVYTNNEFYAKEYQNKYPGICYYVSSVEELIDKLTLQNNYDEIKSSFEKFELDHSKECVILKLKDAVNKIVYSPKG